MNVGNDLTPVAAAVRDPAEDFLLAHLAMFLLAHLVIFPLAHLVIFPLAHLVIFLLAHFPADQRRIVEGAAAGSAFLDGNLR